MISLKILRKNAPAPMFCQRIKLFEASPEVQIVLISDEKTFKASGCHGTWMGIFEQLQKGKPQGFM